MSFYYRLFLVVCLVSNLAYSPSYAVGTATAPKKPATKTTATAAAPAPAPVAATAPAPVIATAAKARPNPNGLKVGEQPLLPAKDVQSQMTPTQAFPKVFVTGPYTTLFPQLVETGADGGLIDANLSIAFRTGTNGYERFNGQKKFDINFHYELGDPRGTDQAIAEVKDPSFSHVIHITDLNTALQSDGTELTTYELQRLIKEGKFKNSSEGQELKRLLEATNGEWEVFGSDNLYSQRKGVTKAKLQIFSQQVFGKFDTQEQKDKGRGISMRPILHNKERVLGVIGANGVEVPVIGYIAGINLTLPPNVKFDSNGKASPMYRLNAGKFIAEPSLLQNMVDNAHATMDALGNGLGIKGIKPVTPVRVHLVGGGTAILYYTAGVMNPGSIWVDILNNAIATWKTKHGIALGPNDVPATEDIEVEQVESAQFDDSYKPQLLAEERFIGLNTPAKYNKYDAGQFSMPGGFGFTPVYAGFPLDRTMGGQLRDFTHSFIKNPNFTSSVFFAPIPGMKRTKSSEDPTDVILLHSKDLYAIIQKAGVKTFHGEDGSFNRSGHEGLSDGQVGNSESRLVYDIPMTDEFSQAMMEMIPKMMAEQAKIGRVYKAVDFVTMDYIADITGRLLENIELKDVQLINSMIQKAQSIKTEPEMKKAYGEVLDRIQAIFDSPVLALDPSTGQREPVKLDHPLSKDKFDASMAKARAILNGYSEFSVPQDARGNGLFVQSFWTLLEHVRNPNEDALEIKQDYDAVLWKPGITPDQLNKNIATLWTKSGIEKPLPADRPAVDVAKAGSDVDSVSKEPVKDVKTKEVPQPITDKKVVVVRAPSPIAALKVKATPKTQTQQATAQVQTVPDDVPLSLVDCVKKLADIHRTRAVKASK